jgi:hypothetical protein
LKFPAEALALLRRDRLDVLGRPGALLQASAPLEDLLLGPVVVRDPRPDVVVTSVFRHTYYILAEAIT